MESSEILSIHFFYSELSPAPDGYIIVGGNSKKIQVYSLSTGDLFCTMTGHKDSVTCFAQDGEFMISGSDDCSVIIWNTGEWYSQENHGKTKTIRPHKVLEGHT